MKTITRTLRDVQLLTAWDETLPSQQRRAQPNKFGLRRTGSNQSSEEESFNAGLTLSKPSIGSELEELLTASAEPAQETDQEEILAWWHGRITAVGRKSFEAELCDLTGSESIATIENKTVGHAQQGDIREGARFIYYVTRVDQIDGARTYSSIEFLPAYIPQEGDASIIKRRLSEIYDSTVDTSDTSRR